MRGRWSFGAGFVALLLAPLVVVAVAAQGEATPTFADPAFRAVWGRTDGPVAAKTATRTFLWGPGPLSGSVREPYAQSPDGTRLVQYFDKSRMEITNPAAAATDPFYVTNGLLVLELMTGRVQVGADPKQTEQRDPATANAVGDPTDRDAPTYLTLARLRDLPARAVGAATVERVARDGTVFAGGPGTPSGGVTAATLVPETRHTVASVFWRFMTEPEAGADGTGNPFYATGYPLTEAYWATVRVGGTPREVLVQAFERRVLTYTPDNPEGFKVEAGNVGQHYYGWRYAAAARAETTATATVYVAPSTKIGPITVEKLQTGRYNLAPGDLPMNFGFRFDGVVSNELLIRNTTDANYAVYLPQWQRLTGYRRTFTRSEPENQVSTVQTIVSVYRDNRGALAHLNHDRERLRGAAGVTITDGPFGAATSYVKTDVSSGSTLYTVVWQQGNTMGSIDVGVVPKVGLTLADARSLAQEQYRRINLDIP